MKVVAAGWRGLLLPFLALLIAGGAAQAGTQVAQLGPGGAPGVMKATAFADLPGQAEWDVDPYDDSDLDLQIKARFDQELAQRQLRVSEQGNLQLLFETRILQGEFRTTAPSLGSVQAGGQSDFKTGGSRGVDANVNIWSSTKDSELGGKQKRTTTSRASVFHINVVLRDRQTGQTLWQGDAYCEMLTSDTQRIALSMVPPLVENMGRTVQDVPFDIQ